AGGVRGQRHDGRRLPVCTQRSRPARARRHRARGIRRHSDRPLRESAADHRARAHRRLGPRCAREPRAAARKAASAGAGHAHFRLRHRRACLVRRHAQTRDIEQQENTSEQIEMSFREENMRKRLPLRKKLLASLITAAVASTAVSPQISWAQTAEAALRGKAPANADVTAKNVNTGEVRRTRAGADGAYALVGLAPGTYQVDAGPGTAKTVTLTVASTATLDLEAGAPGPGAPTTTLEGISVNATTLVETKTPEVGQTISLHQIETVPQITRNFLEFADTVPGVIFSVDPSGHTKLTGGAQNANGVNVYIDG